MADRSDDNSKREYRQHGLYGAKTALKEYGSRALDRRTSAARAVAAWKDAVAESMGGDLSAQQETVLELAALDVYLVRSIDVWLMSELAKGHVPFNRKSRDKGVWRVVTDRMKIADALTRRLQALGLDKATADKHDLSAYVEETYGNGGKGPGAE